MMLQNFTTTHADEMTRLIVISQAIVAIFRHVAHMGPQRGMGMLATSHHVHPSECKHRVLRHTANPPISPSPFCNTQHFHAKLSPTSLDCVQAILVPSFLPCHVAMFATPPPLRASPYIPTRLQVLSISYLLQSFAHLSFVFKGASSHVSHLLQGRNARTNFCSPCEQRR